MSTYSQLFPTAPTFTEKDIIDLSSKVYIITNATSSPGLELAKILYALHATVYIGSHTTTSFSTTCKEINSHAPTSQGTLKPFLTDLSELSSIKLAAESFLKENYRLDVLFLNADVPAESNDSNFLMRANCLAPFLLTRLLYPLMHRTTTHFCHINTSIRIVYTSSLLTLSAPQGGGKWVPTQLSGMEDAIYLLAHEFALRHKFVDKVDEHGIKSRNTAGVLHVCANTRTEETGMLAAIRGILGRTGKEAKFGAYTELFAGIAPGVEDGDFIIPWGRKGVVPEYIQASKAVREGEEQSVSARFYEWCEEKAKPLL